MDLKCYVYSGWRPRIRAAGSRRAWMDASPEHFAYRCLPLNIANSHGWELLSPCGFEAEWNGGGAVDDVVIRPDPETDPLVVPVALFGQGTLTFHVDGLFRTPEGYDLWVGGSPNSAKDGIAPLGGVIETDWSPYSFTMNWRFTRADHVIRFEENEPFCFFFPVERRLIETVDPRIVAIEEDPEFHRHFEEWSASRDAFHASVAKDPPSTPSKKWQKFYYRGVRTDGVAGAADHRSKLRLKEFAGSEEFHRETKPGPACPVAQDRQRTPADGGDGAAAKLGWLLESRERLRHLAPLTIARREKITAEAFLADHYAANVPLLLHREVADWAAVARWTPHYLKQLVGPRAVEVQAGRTDDPDYERHMVEHRGSMAFDAFIDEITRPGAANDLYMTAYNSGANAETLGVLHADLGFVERLLDRHGHVPRGMPWIGASGTFTPLHHDLTNNLLLQMVGRKRILMVAPGETPKLYNDHHVYSRVRDLSEPGIASRFPKLDGVHVHQLILEPGDGLFIPLGWWHQVAALDFSVTITHTNFRWPNDFHAAHPG